MLVPRSCSCNKYTNHLLKSALWQLDFSKGFIEKKGVVIHYTFYLSLLLFFSVILVHLN
jgi:hypothetical protein